MLSSAKKHCTPADSNLPLAIHASGKSRNLAIVTSSAIGSSTLFQRIYLPVHRLSSVSLFLRGEKSLSFKNPPPFLQKSFPSFLHIFSRTGDVYHSAFLEVLLNQLQLPPFI